MGVCVFYVLVDRWNNITLANKKDEWYLYN